MEADCTQGMLLNILGILLPPENYFLRMKLHYFKRGIRFSCTGCGKCCLGHNGYEYVYFSLEERRCAALLLNLSLGVFTKKYMRKTEGFFHLKFEKGACPFLKKNKCLIYAARPEQCRTWPFWKENMTEGVWEKEVAPYCPGIGNGTYFSLAEIRRVLS
jgi:Fe-S-cluster containining protein